MWDTDVDVLLWAKLDTKPYDLIGISHTLSEQYRQGVETFWNRSIYMLQPTGTSK